jgi:hypothetical protein
MSESFEKIQYISNITECKLMRDKAKQARDKAIQAYKLWKEKCRALRKIKLEEQSEEEPEEEEPEEQEEQEEPELVLSEEEGEEQEEQKNCRQYIKNSEKVKDGEKFINPFTGVANTKGLRKYREQLKKCEKFLTTKQKQNLLPVSTRKSGSGKKTDFSKSNCKSFLELAAKTKDGKSFTNPMTGIDIIKGNRTYKNWIKKCMETYEKLITSPPSPQKEKRRIKSPKIKREKTPSPTPKSRSTSPPSPQKEKRRVKSPRFKETTPSSPRKSRSTSPPSPQKEKRRVKSPRFKETTPSPPRKSRSPTRRKSLTLPKTPSPQRRKSLTPPKQKTPSPPKQKTPSPPKQKTPSPPKQKTPSPPKEEVIAEKLPKKESVSPLSPKRMAAQEAIKKLKEEKIIRPTITKRKITVYDPKIIEERLDVDQKIAKVLSSMLKDIAYDTLTEVNLKTEKPEITKKDIINTMKKDKELSQLLSITDDQDFIELANQMNNEEIQKMVNKEKILTDDAVLFINQLIGFWLKQIKDVIDENEGIEAKDIIEAAAEIFSQEEKSELLALIVQNAKKLLKGY